MKHILKENPKYKDINKIEVKKTDEEITYMRKTTTTTYQVNGKEVQVYQHYSDGRDEMPDNEIIIDEQDAELLTDAEYQAIDENLCELLQLKNGESILLDNE